MKLLVIGGTHFLGRSITEFAIENDHDITLFNRGKSRPNLFTDVRQIHGDRDSDLNLLPDEQWDAVIDTCGYFPQQTDLSASLLKDRAGCYIFISSVSAYHTLSKIGITEEDEIDVFEGERPEQIDGANYGPLKGACERMVQKHFGDRAIIIRPGLIVGPWDYSYRFGYLPIKYSLGGEMVLPANPNTPFQFIDVRDLARWCFHLVEESITGTFNAVGPEVKTTLGGIMESCKGVFDTDTIIHYVDNKIIEKHQYPLWNMIEPDSGYEGLDEVNGTKALKAGLRLRPIEETIRDTVTWYHESGKNYFEKRFPIESEQAILEEWKAQLNKSE